MKKTENQFKTFYMCDFLMSKRKKSKVERYIVFCGPIF